MSATTPKHAIPYAVPADLRSQLPTIDKAQQDRIEALLNPPAIATVYTNSTPFTAATGWTIAATSRWVRTGRTIHIYFSTTRTGASLATSGSTGWFVPSAPIIANLIASVPKPITTVGATLYEGVGVCLRLTSAGVLTLQAMHPSQTFATNNVVAGHFSYISAP